MSLKDDIRNWYKGLDRKAQKTAKIIAGFVALVLLAFLLSMCSAPAKGAIAMPKSTDRLGYTSYVPTILAPVFKCEVLEVSGVRLNSNFKVPDRPQQGDKLTDYQQRQRTIASVTVNWSGVTYGQQATIPCSIVVVPS